MDDRVRDAVGELCEMNLTLQMWLKSCLQEIVDGIGAIVIWTIDLRGRFGIAIIIDPEIQAATAVVRDGCYMSSYLCLAVLVRL